MEQTSAAWPLGELDGSSLMLKSSTPLMTAKATTSQAQASLIQETEFGVSSEDSTTIEMNVLTIDWGQIKSHTNKDNSFSENMVPSTETLDLLGHLLGPQRQTTSSITTTLVNGPMSTLLDSLVGAATTFASSGDNRADAKSIYVPSSRATPGSTVFLVPSPMTQDGTFCSARLPITIAGQYSGMAPTDTASQPDRCLTRNQHVFSTESKSFYSPDESPTHEEDQSRGVASIIQDVFRAAATGSSTAQRTTQEKSSASSLVPVAMPAAGGVEGSFIGATKTTTNRSAASQTTTVGKSSQTSIAKSSQTSIAKLSQTSIGKSSQTISNATTSDAGSVRWLRTTPLLNILQVLLVLSVVSW